PRVAPPALPRRGRPASHRRRPHPRLSARCVAARSRRLGRGGWQARLIRRTTPYSWIMPTLRSARTGIGAVLSAGGEILSAVMQLLLIWIAARVVWGSDDPDVEILLRLVWCVLATVYLGATILTLNMLVRLDVPDPRATRVLVGHPIARALSTAVTFGTSALG